ncbi:MAG: hypothetical protein OCD76_14355 [Reichenbachiella sp.]
MTKLFLSLLLISSFTTYSQTNLMNDKMNLIQLELNVKTEINDSLSIVLTRFSHKNPIEDGQRSIGSAHLILFQGDKEYEVMISMFGVRGKPISEDGLSDNERYQSIIWNEYTVQLKNFSYDQSIGVFITKTEDLIRQKIALGKIQLIDEANSFVGYKYPGFTFSTIEYEITTWANSKRVVVKYRRLIRFTPLGKENENLDYDFEVDLTNQNTSFDTWGMDKFYIPTTEEQEKINFVMNAFGLPLSGFDNSIIEEADSYRINIDSEASFGRYVIDKTTGNECEGSIQGSYEPMPDDILDDLPRFPDPLIEIVD